MNFQPGCLYHLHNRTFNNTLAFPKRDNYRFFVKSLSRLLTSCDILSYCLLPTNFDLVVYIPVDSKGLRMTRAGQMQVFSRQIGTLLSSYAQAYNKQVGRRGSLFQPKTKSTRLTSNARECVKVIHAKPVSLGFAFQASEWEFSSFRDYLGVRTSTCNIDLGRTLNLM